MDEIIKDFLIESGENLDCLDQELVRLESDPTSVELLASIFRAIHSIKGSCGFAVRAIGSITDVIHQISSISGTIATAVEEQSATTSEMTRNVGDAASGSREIAKNIEGVVQAAQSTSSSTHESQKAANELAQMAVQLRTLVDQFRTEAGANGASIGTQSHTKNWGAAAGR
jgi:methyl-accepting chemotaxis protein